MKPRQQPGTISWCRTCCGVDLADGGPIAVRATRTRTGVACTRIDPGDPSLRGASGGTGLVVAGCLSERESFSRWLDTPFRSARKAVQVLPSILDIQLPFPLEDCAYLFLPGGIAEDGKTMALAVAARSAGVRKKLDAYMQLGMDPVALDQEGIALWTQSILEIPPDGETTRVVVSLSGNYATVALGTGMAFRGSHSVRQGADHIGRILRTKLGSLTQSLEWAWTGPSATPENIGSLFQVLRESWPGKSLVHKDPATFLARAIATRALSAGPFRCNLRIGALEHPVLAARRRTHHVNTALAALFAGLILAAASVASTAMANRRLKNAEDAFSSQVDKLAGYHVDGKGERALAKVRKAQKERLKVNRPFDAAFEPSLVGTLDAILQIGKENSLAYETLVLGKEKDRDIVSISGTCATWNQCEKLSQRLKDLGYSVRPDRKESSGRIYFTIVQGGPGDRT